MSTHHRVQEEALTACPRHSFSPAVKAGVYTRTPRTRAASGPASIASRPTAKLTAWHRGWEVVEVFRDNDASACGRSLDGPFDLVERTRARLRRARWVLENEWGGHVPQISVSVLFWAVPLAAGVVRTMRRLESFPSSAASARTAARSYASFSWISSRPAVAEATASFLASSSICPPINRPPSLSTGRRVG